MNRILIIGCGDVARRFIPLLRGRFCVFGLIRNPVQRAALRAVGATPVLGDLDQPASLRRIAGLSDIVLHFAPPPPSGDDHDPRTRHLLAALSQGRLPQRFIYISTSGVYGDCGGDWVDETRPPHPQTARAARRLDAERQIRHWARAVGVSACLLRVPGIYAAGRLPLERLRSGIPAIHDAEDSYTNHIHADDLAHIALAALRHGKPNRIYHASDDSQLKMGAYFDAVADAYALPRPPRLSRAEAQSALSPALLSFINESRRLRNTRLKRELKVRLFYPTVAHTLGKYMG